MPFSFGRVNTEFLLLCRRGVDLIAEFAGQSVPVRVITPTEPPRGAILSLHGGGFYFGAAAYDDMWNRELADALGVAHPGVGHDPRPAAPRPREAFPSPAAGPPAA